MNGITMSRMTLVLCAALAVVALSCVLRDGVLLLGGLLLAAIALVGMGVEARACWQRGIRLAWDPEASLHSLEA